MNDEQRKNELPNDKQPAPPPSRAALPPRRQSLAEIIAEKAARKEPGSALDLAPPTPAAKPVRPLKPAPAPAAESDSAPPPPAAEPKAPADPRLVATGALVQEGRSREFHQAALVLGALLLVGLSVYFGTKLPYLKYLVASHHAPALTKPGAELYPGVAAADLVQRALAAQEAGDWEKAVGLFMAAKTKDLRFRGILFRVGKILYDHRNFDTADSAFERAIAFGENVEAANYYRGLIAVRHRDLTAAERFFELAVAASPFTPDYHYFWGETLRVDLKPKQAVPHYEQAALLARNAQDAAVCRFKIRMAKIEAADGDEVDVALGKRKAAGPLPVDWLMSAAALQLREGKVEGARQLITEARAGTAPGLFASCVNDLYFRDAAKKYPELAEALHLDLDLQVPFPD